MKIKEKNRDFFDVEDMVQVLELNDSIACIGDMATRRVKTTSGFRKYILSSATTIDDWLQSMNRKERREVEAVIQEGTDKDNTVIVNIEGMDYSCRIRKMTSSKWVAVLKSEGAALPVPSLPEPLQAELTMGLLILSEKKEIVYVNSAMEKLTAINFSAFYHQPLQKVLDDDKYDLLFHKCEEAIEKDTRVDFNIDCMGEGCHISICPSWQGLVVFAHGFSSGYGEEPLPSEKTVQLMEKHTNDVFWISDPDLRHFYYLSPSIQRFFEPEASEEETPESLKRMVYEEDRQRLNRALTQMKEGKSRIDIRVDKEGDEKWVRVTGVPFLYERKEYIVGTLKDISNEKKAAYLEKKSDHLSVISQMSAGIAHEIKNPLTVIKGFLQLGEANPDLQKEYQGVILKEVERMETIVQDFMLLVKPKSKLEKTRVHIPDLVSYTLQLLKNHRKHVLLYCRNGAGTEDFHTDERRLKQVLLNIVKNAIEAVEEEGEVRVGTYRDNGNLVLTVLDNGSGIPEEDIQQLGEPFYTTKEKGTGLGVMVTKKIVEDLGGTIRYDSEVGKGTKVTVTLPENT